MSFKKLNSHSNDVLNRFKCKNMVRQAKEYLSKWYRELKPVIGLTSDASGAMCLPVSLANDCGVEGILREACFREVK